MNDGGVHSTNSEERAHDAFLRWQETRRKQLGDTVNLVLTLTVASLGFGLNLIVSDKTHVLPRTCVFSFSLFCLSAAALLGLLINYSRLQDFRYSATAARELELAARAEAKGDEEGAKKHRQDHAKFSDLADRQGQTWTRLFVYGQLASFGVGITLLAGYIWWSYK
jgi:hypothetical protein